METENNIVNNNEEETKQETKVYTEEEVLKLIQKESDKRVSQALQTQEKKHKRELSLSKLDDEAREKAEKENRIAELEEKLAKYEIEKNKSEIKSVLSSRNLSAEFADILNITDDVERNQANIDTLDKLFKLAVKNEVERRLASNTPKGNTAGKVELNKDNVKKLSINELNELYTKDPDKFRELFG